MFPQFWTKCFPSLGLSFLFRRVEGLLQWPHPNLQWVRSQVSSSPAIHGAFSILILDRSFCTAGIFSLSLASWFWLWFIIRDYSTQSPWNALAQSVFGPPIIFFFKPYIHIFVCFLVVYLLHSEKAMALHSSALAWKIPWMEEPGGLQSMGSLRVGHDWATSLSLFTFMHWRRNWQPTPVFLPGESQGRRSLVGAVYGVAQSQTRLKWLSSSSSSICCTMRVLSSLTRDWTCTCCSESMKS